LIASTSRVRVGLGWVLAAVASALLASGCGASSHPATSSHPAPSSSSTAAVPAAAGTTITVDETEFRLALSPSATSFTAGAYTFIAVNRGTIEHALAITGPGVDARTRTLTPGESAELHVTLHAGSYDLFCPVDSHKALGMNQEITVNGSPAGGTPATSSAAVAGYASAGY
jgi:uncharacterized cupredoxin-like copper-binding protein